MIEHDELLETSEDTSFLPEIEIYNRQLRDITQDALSAIQQANYPPRLFLRDNMPVRIKWDASDNASIEILNEVGMRHMIARLANWKRTTKKGQIFVSPPMEVVEDLMAFSEPPKGVPGLRGISSCPIVCKDGTVHTDYGYSEASRWFLTERRQWKDSKMKGPDAAQLILKEVLPNFPFVDAASQAHSLALMLLPMLRNLIDGPTPLHLVDAPEAGTGKGKLVKACLLPALGYEPSVTTVPVEDKFRTLLFSLLNSGTQAIVLDNLSGTLKSDALEACITTGELQDRLLGGNKTPRVKVRSIFAATANNGTLSPDMVRRSVLIKLDAGVENPSKRQDFKHPDLLPWVSKNRLAIVSALLAMCRHWIAQGMPRSNQKKGTFEAWAGIVGGVLESCEIEGFLANDEEFRASANIETEEWRAFYNAWYEDKGLGICTSSILTELVKNRGLLESILTNGTEHGRSVQFGKALKKQDGRVLSGMRIELVKDADGTPLFNSGYRQYRLSIVNSKS